MEISTKTDIVGRYSGDEFILVLPGTLRTGSEKLSEKILSAVQEHDFRVGDGLIKLTVSLGISHFDNNIESTDTFIKQADHALYVSKRSGRNKASVFSSSKKPCSADNHEA